MKKSFSVFIVLFTVSRLFCQSNVIQIVIPQKIYVGDTVELHYSFVSELDLFSQAPAKSEMQLPLDRLTYESDNDDFLIKKLLLQKNGKSYTIIITFVPWKTGFLKIPDINLSDVIPIDSAIPFMIAPSACEVSSMLPENADIPLKEPCPPLLLPGTMYVIYGLLICFLLFAAIILNVVVRRKKIYDAIRRQITLRRYAKNARKTIRFLDSLLKDAAIADAEFARRFETGMRGYLTVRFGRNFTVEVSSRIGLLIEEASGGFLDGERQNASFSLVSLFIRADYIRFAQNSIDSQRLPKETYNASFNDGEKKSMVEAACSAILTFEDCRAMEKNVESKNKEGGENAWL